MAEGASFAALEREMKKLEVWLDKQEEIENYVAYIGDGSPRFYLPIIQQLRQRNIAQIVILAKDINHRELLRSKLITLFEEDFYTLRASVSRLENGPPVGFPVQFRVSGPEFDQLRSIAYQVAEVMQNNIHLSNVQLDWDEMVKVVRIDVDQSKARLLGVSSYDLANLVKGAFQGLYVTEFREGIELIDVKVRGIESERRQLSAIENLMVPTASGQSVSLSQIARIHYDFEEGVIGRRNRIPTIIVRANVYGKIQAPTVSKQIEQQLDDIKQNIPIGYRIETGGSVEESAKGRNSVVSGIPLLLLSVLTILMIQLQNFSKTMRNYSA
jgi:multidrug efflux pump